jgi:hypothetical protein
MSTIDTAPLRRLYEETGRRFSDAVDTGDPADPATLNVQAAVLGHTLGLFEQLPFHHAIDHIRRCSESPCLRFNRYRLSGDEIRGIVADTLRLAVAALPGHTHTDPIRVHHRLLEHLHEKSPSGHDLQRVTAAEFATIADCDAPFPYYESQPTRVRQLDGFGTPILTSLHMELHGQRPVERRDPAPEMIVESEGRAFTVRYVRRGDRYGRLDCLLNDAEPMVEFYDRATITEETGPRGLFTGGRYNAQIILEGAERFTSAGLRLGGGWEIPSVAMVATIDFLRRHHAPADTGKDS